VVRSGEKRCPPRIGLSGLQEVFQTRPPSLMEKQKNALPQLAVSRILASACASVTRDEENIA